MNQLVRQMAIECGCPLQFQGTDEKLKDIGLDLEDYTMRVMRECLMALYASNEGESIRPVDALRKHFGIEQ